MEEAPVERTVVAGVGEVGPVRPQVGEVPAFARAKLLLAPVRNAPEGKPPRIAPDAEFERTGAEEQGVLVQDPGLRFSLGGAAAEGKTGPRVLPPRVVHGAHADRALARRVDFEKERGVLERGTLVDDRVRRGDQPKAVGEDFGLENLDGGEGRDAFAGEPVAVGELHERRFRRNSRCGRSGQAFSSEIAAACPLRSSSADSADSA